MKMVCKITDKINVSTLQIIDAETFSVRKGKTTHFNYLYLARQSRMLFLKPANFNEKGDARACHILVMVSYPNFRSSA